MTYFLFLFFFFSFLFFLLFLFFFFFNDTATTEIYTLSLHDALPIPVSTCGVMLAARLRCGPGPPARNLASSGEKSNRRGVWHSVQCPAPPARYAPRASPSRGATFDAVGIVRLGTGIFRDRAGTDDLIGVTLFR